MSDEVARNGKKSEQTERLLLELGRDHPVQAALGRAGLIRLQRFNAAAARGETATLDQLATEIEEILAWFTGTPGNAATQSQPSGYPELDFLTDMIRRGVLTYPQAEELKAVNRRFHRGRRISDGIRIVSALEAKQNDPSTSWPKLASKFCEKTEGKHQRDATEEDKNQHDSGCIDRLRHRVKILEKFLARLSPGENA